jgi:hypothetical protein
MNRSARFLTLLVLASACAIPTAFAQAATFWSGRDDQAAHSFVRYAAEISRDIDRLQMSIQRDLSRSLESCDIVPSTKARLHTQTTFEQLRQEQVLARRYHRFARQIRALRLSATRLRRLVSLVSRIDIEYAKLLRNDYDVCRFLEAWRSEGWSERYARNWYAARFARAGVDVRVASRTSDALIVASSALETFGVTHTDAWAFASAAAVVSTF